MKNIIIITIITLTLIIVGCKSKQPIIVPTNDMVSILCGTFTSPDSSGILVSIKLSDWNIAEVVTPFDEMFLQTVETLRDKPARPASRYFINGDTLYLEMDKGYFLYKVQDENTLLGIGMWNNNEKLIRQKGEHNTCPKTHKLTGAEKKWLQQSRLYYQAYYSTDYTAAVLVLERICEEGYGPACMTLGLNTVMQNEEKGIALLEKACDIGYFGGYACFQLGDVLSRFEEKEEEAKTAYQKACEGGHLVGCMVVENELFKKQ